MFARLMLIYVIPSVLSLVGATELERALNLASQGLRTSATAGQLLQENCTPRDTSTLGIQVDYRVGGSFAVPEKTTGIQIENQMIQKVIRESGYNQNPLPIFDSAKNKLVDHYGGSSNLKKGNVLFRRATMDIRYFHQKLVAALYGQNLEDYLDNNYNTDLHAILDPITAQPIGFIAHTARCRRENAIGIVTLDSITTLESSGEQGCQGGTIIQIAQTYSFHYNSAKKALEISPQKAGVEFVENGQTKQIFADTAEVLFATLNRPVDSVLDCALTFDGYDCRQELNDKKMTFSKKAQPECKKLQKETMIEFIRRENTHENAR